jgi:5-methyltetrahydrofolate--homocysteine methyltransferase
VIVFDLAGQKELTRFSFPRQNKEGGLCIADFFHDVASNERDLIAPQVVTMGRRASEAAREWFAQNRYQDYLSLHGLSVEMVEALAEYLHWRIRGELGFAAEEARAPEAMLAQGYRGSRYSFGYPACPDLADQKQLLALLDTDEIGITLSEEDQLDPEQSTSAIIGRIATGRDALGDGHRLRRGHQLLQPSPRGSTTTSFWSWPSTAVPT